MVDRDRLDVVLSKVELFEALTSMKNGKSPGIYGLPCELFKAMCNTIGEHLCCLANEAFSSSTLTTSLNLGVIKFILNNVSRDTI